MCARAYTENPRPMRLGNMFVFWYNKKNQPRIVIGPDFGYTCVELALVNGICGFILFNALTIEMTLLFGIGLALVLFHNLAFLLTVCWNQGLPPRNPNEHSQGYLNKVKTIE